VKTWIRAYVRWVVSIVLAWGMLAGSAPALSAREIESGGPSRQDELISAAQRAVVGTRVRPAQDTRAGAVMASSAPSVREAGDRAELDLSITDLGARSDDLSAQVLCAAPVAVDLEGPTTAIVDEFATFTATVIVVKATTPITYHWQFPGGLERTEALDTWTSSMTPRLSVTGTHMVTATVSNACGEIVSARRVQIVEPAQPDLVVTDFWSEGDEVWVQVTNVGQATAPGGHIVEVLAGDLVVGSQRVYDDLAPGRRWVGVMNGLWSCSGDQDTMQATADTSDVVDEKDERNNGRRETWRCDTQPPVITKGPAVSAITSDSARVSWLTDEPADSAVQYGTTLGGYANSTAFTTPLAQYACPSDFRLSGYQRHGTDEPGEGDAEYQ